MRRGGVWSHKAKATAVIVVIAVCIAVGVTVSGAARLSASKHSAKSSDSRDAHVSSASQAGAALAAALKFAPAPGATAAAPDSPVVVTAGAGSLLAVRVATSTGANVPGMLTPSANAWESTGALAYGTEYHVRATVVDTSGARATSTMSFHTLAPSAVVTASVFPSDGLSVGVGQPVVFKFSQPITDPAARASLLTHLSVDSSTPVVGGWYWFSDQELHYRPQVFWPPDEQVTVSADLTGWDAGNGAWGAGGGTTHFAIGDSHIAYANLVTDKMNVTDNGRTIATYPISGGKPTDPTMDVVHIVLDRSSVVRMNSATNGVPVNSPDGYDELVYSDVHISDSGEYVHAAPWSVNSQGRTNVSHGCINLSPDNAAAFFAFSRVGDVVLVVGSPRPPALGDHGVMDWDTDWSSFTPANVILPAPSTLPGLG